MANPTVHSRLNAVEARALKFERWMKLMAVGWLATVVLFLMSAWVPLPQAAAQDPKGTTDVVRARQFVVVDEKGTERIVIGPVPDPQIMGKRIKRRSVGNGILVNDASGNERAGFGLLDDGSVVLGIDDEASRERAHLYFIPKRGAGLLLQGEGGKRTVSLLVPAEQSANPQFEMTDRTGNRIAAFPAQK
jgi:hypothetical protein